MLKYTKKYGSILKIIYQIVIIMNTLPFALSNAINDGDIPGHRTLYATLFIGKTGSQLRRDLHGFSPNLNWVAPKQMSGITDGVDGLRNY